MAITSYQENDKTFWKVSVVKNSKLVRSIKVRRAKTGIATESEANKIERKLRREAENEVRERETDALSWWQLVDKWELSLRKQSEFSKEKLSKAVAMDYLGVLRKYTQTWHNRRVSSVLQKDVEEILTKAKLSGKSTSRLKAIKSSIDIVFKWGIAKGHIPTVKYSPAANLSISRKGNEKLQKVLTYDESKRFLMEAKQSGSEWYPVWAMALNTGMRSGELYALCWDDIDFENGLIKVHQNFNFLTKEVGPTKGRYWRTVPINPELRELLVELRESCNSGYVLPRINYWRRGEAAKVLKIYLQGLRMPMLRFHDLRATWATLMLSRGVPAVTVMKIGGWADLDTLQIYVRLAGIEEKGATDCLSLM